MNEVFFRGGKEAAQFRRGQMDCRERKARRFPVRYRIGKGTAKTCEKEELRQIFSCCLAGIEDQGDPQEEKTFPITVRGKFD